MWKKRGERETKGVERQANKGDIVIAGTFVLADMGHATFSSVAYCSTVSNTVYVI